MIVKFCAIEDTRELKGEGFECRARVVGDAFSI